MMWLESMTVTLYILSAKGKKKWQYVHNDPNHWARVWLILSMHKYQFPFPIWEACSKKGKKLKTEIREGTRKQQGPPFPGMEREIACFAHERLSLILAQFLSVGAISFKIRLGSLSSTSLQPSGKEMDPGKKGWWKLSSLEGRNFAI